MNRDEEKFVFGRSKRWYGVPYDGLIDDIRVYGIGLSKSEVVGIKNGEIENYEDLVKVEGLRWIQRTLPFDEVEVGLCWIK